MLRNASTVLHNIRMPSDWRGRWPDFALHLTLYQRKFRANRWHDAADVLTGIVEREVTEAINKKIKALYFPKRI